MEAQGWRIIDILLSSTPIMQGDPAAGVMFTALDITERKRSEDALRRGKEHLRAITENLPRGVPVLCAGERRAWDVLRE